MTETVLKRESDYDDIVRAASKMAKRMNANFVVDERKARDFLDQNATASEARNKLLAVST